MAALDAENPETPDTGDDHFMSMTDLVISLLFIFIIMLMGYALTFKQAEATSRDEYAELKRRQERVATERAVLQQQEGELTRERDSVGRQRDLLASERESVVREQSVLTRERDALRETQVSLTRERNEAESNRERIVAERVSLERRRTGATQALEKVRETTLEITNRKDRERDLLSSLVVRFNQIDAAIDAQLDAKSGTLRFSERILFATGQSQLTPQGQEAIARIGEALGEILPCYTGAAPGTYAAQQNCPDAQGVQIDTVLIEGHTDRTGIDESNWRLSADRAIQTYFALTSRRPEIRAIRNARGEPIIGVSGYGPDRPVDEVNLDRNRRIDVRFVFAAPLGEEMSRMEQTLRETLGQ